MAIGLFFLSESPRWLFSKHRDADAVEALTWLRQLPMHHPYVAEELEDYRRQMEHEATLAPEESFWAILKETFSPRVLPRVIHGCLLMILQNSTGINAMNNFSVSFFASLGFHGTVCESLFLPVVPTADLTSTSPLNYCLREYMVLSKASQLLSRFCFWSTDSDVAPFYSWGRLCALSRCTMLPHSLQLQIPSIRPKTPARQPTPLLPLSIYSEPVT